MEIHNLQKKTGSYLRARYSSILAQSGSPTIENLELGAQINNIELGNCNEEKSKESENDRLQVYLRLKKVSNCDLYNVLDDKTLVCKVADGSKTIRQGLTLKKIYKFSKIFDRNSSQSDLFDYVKLKVAHFINGYNCSLLTYGASGSGKTYTIIGTADEPGIIPRAFEHIFRSLPPLPKEPEIKPLPTGGVVELSDANKKNEKMCIQTLLDKFNGTDQNQHLQTYRTMQQKLCQDPLPDIITNGKDLSLGVWVSFAEIYNECIYDLLKPDVARGQTRQKLRLGQSNGNTYIKDLTCLSVSSGLEAYQILQFGLHNLKYAATSVNYHSSRSHAIFTIKLAQTCSDKDGVCVSSFNFCDLAGSERAKKTNNVGDRLKESNNINTSLMVLGRCISLIRQSQKQKDSRLIPFRESKLTQLFQKALSGQEAISMIVNINPIPEMFHESQQVLNFSAVVKDVALEEQEVLIHVLKNKFGQHFNNIPNGNLDNIAEEEDNYMKEELREEYFELYEYFTQLQKEAEEYQNGLRSRYKKLVQDIDNYWEKRYLDLKNQMEENAVKKQKSSIIVLDSSSEDDDSFEEAANNDVKLKEQIEEAQLKFNSKKEELKRLTDKNKELKETLEDAVESYSQLNKKYQMETKEFHEKIYLENEKIIENKMIYHDLQKQLATRCENQEESKNSTTENVKEAVLETSKKM